MAHAEDCRCNRCLQKQVRSESMKHHDEHVDFMRPIGSRPNHHRTNRWFCWLVIMLAILLCIAMALILAIVWTVRIIMDDYVQQLLQFRTLYNETFTELANSTLEFQQKDADWRSNYMRGDGPPTV